MTMTIDTRTADPPVRAERRFAPLIHLARQRMLNRDGELFGYELLYRDGPDTTSRFDDPDMATLRVIERVLLHWGMERAIGDRFGLINASPSLICSGLHRSMPAEGIIFELREDEPYDDEVVAALDEAHRDGYHFAIEHVTSVADLEWSRLIGIASMVKVPVSMIPASRVSGIAQHVRRRHPGTLLVAERIETADQYALAAEAGFDLFQGFLFGQPELLSHPNRPVDAAAATALLGVTGSPAAPRDGVDVDAIERIVGLDPSLTYRVIAMVNSCAFGLDRRVGSLDHAIHLLGVRQVRHLATLLSVSAIHELDESSIVRGLARARLVDLVTRGSGHGQSSATACLLSVTDAIYGTSIDALLADLHVTAEITGGLTVGDGPVGEHLRLADACERGDWEELESISRGCGDRMLLLYEQAVDWAREVRRDLHAAV
jgi:EAL and modified HD-GYP domain-containing signal transduction protein